MGVNPFEYERTYAPPAPAPELAISRRVGVKTLKRQDLVQVLKHPAFQAYCAVQRGGTNDLFAQL